MYIDLLTKIKNAQAAEKEGLKVNYSNMDFVIAELLAEHKFIEGVSKKGRMPKRIMEIKLKYNDKRGVIRGVRFISKPSREIYIGYKEIKPVRQGYGLSVISTSKGIMSGKKAKKIKLGGQLLFEIW